MLSKTTEYCLLVFGWLWIICLVIQMNRLQTFDVCCNNVLKCYWQKIRCMILIFNLGLMHCLKLCQKWPIMLISRYIINVYCVLINVRNLLYETPISTHFQTRSMSFRPSRYRLEYQYCFMVSTSEIAQQSSATEMLLHYHASRRVEQIVSTDDVSAIITDLFCI